MLGNLQPFSYRVWKSPHVLHLVNPVGRPPARDRRQNPHHPLSNSGPPKKGGPHYNAAKYIKGPFPDSISVTPTQWKKKKEEGGRKKKERRLVELAMLAVALSLSSIASLRANRCWTLVFDKGWGYSTLISRIKKEFQQKFHLGM